MGGGEDEHLSRMRQHWEYLHQQQTAANWGLVPQQESGIHPSTTPELRHHHHHHHRPSSAGFARAAFRMNVFNVVSEALATYREFLWLFYPLHPAIFDETNVRYYLGDEGHEDICPLSLGINTAICIGTNSLMFRSCSDPKAF